MQIIVKYDQIIKVVDEINFVNCDTGIIVFVSKSEEKTKLCLLLCFSNIGDISNIVSAYINNNKVIDFDRIIIDKYRGLKEEEDYKKRCDRG